MSIHKSKLLTQADKLLNLNSDSAEKIYGPLYWELYYAREEYEEIRKRYSRIGRLVRWWDISSQFHQYQMRLWNLCNSYEKLMHQVASLEKALSVKSIFIKHTVSDKTYNYCITQKNFPEWKRIFNAQLFNPNHQSYKEEIYRKIREKLDPKNAPNNEQYQYNSFYDFLNEIAEEIDKEKPVLSTTKITNGLENNDKLLNKIKRSEITSKIIKKPANDRNWILKRYREELKIKPLPIKPMGNFRDAQFGYAHTQDDGSKSKRFGVGYNQWEITGFIPEEYVDKTALSLGPESKKKVNRIASDMQGSLQKGWYMYVITTDNKFLYLPALTLGHDLNKMDYKQYRCHSELLEGKSCYGSGTFHVDEHGEIDAINTASGHYQPGKPYLNYAKVVLETLGIPIKNSALNFDFYKKNTHLNPLNSIQHYVRVAKQTFFAKFKKDKSEAEERPKEQSCQFAIFTPY